MMLNIIFATCFLAVPMVHTYNAGRPISGGCPSTHPFAVKSGTACCPFPECKFTHEVACPTGSGCISVERENCYHDGNLVETGLPTEDFRVRCRELPRPSPDSSWSSRVQVFYGSGWYISGACHTLHRGQWTCNDIPIPEFEEKRENIDYSDPDVLDALKQEPPKQIGEIQLRV